jgi:hypothetical protein
VAAPRIDQINVVVADVAAATRFLVDLGVELPPAPPGWEAHHVNAPTAPEFEIELDSGVFAQEWGGLPATFRGVVLNVRVDARGDVDALHRRAVSLGAQTLRKPYDAFWGSRFAVVEGPGPVALGILSPREADRMSAPPDPTTFGRPR